MDSKQPIGESLHAPILIQSEVKQASQRKMAYCTADTQVDNVNPQSTLDVEHNQERDLDKFFDYPKDEKGDGSVEASQSEFVLRPNSAPTISSQQPHEERALAIDCAVNPETSVYSPLLLV
jgi:hypothetical protein